MAICFQNKRIITRTRPESRNESAEMTPHLSQSGLTLGLSPHECKGDRKTGVQVRDWGYQRYGKKSFWRSSFGNLVPTLGPSP